MQSLTRTFFTRYFFSRRAGSVVRTMAHICWIATLVGVASLIFVQAVMNGFNRSIRNKLLVAEPHVRVYGQELDAQSLAEESKRFSGESIRRFVEQDVIIRTLDGKFSGSLARAYDEKGVKDYLERLYRFRFRLGADAILTPGTMSLGPKDIAVGVDLARELNIFEGDEVLLFAPETLLLPAGQTPPHERMRVRLLVSSDIPDIDSKLVLYHAGSVAPRFQTERSAVQGLEVRLKDADQAENLKRHILAVPRPGVTSAETWGDRNEALFFALRMEKFAMTLFLSLAVLITCFSLITVLVMLISQKQKEIGLMMAIGLSIHRARRLFLSIGSILSGMGVVLGLALGVGLSVLLEKYPIEILPDIYYDRSLPAQVNWSMVGVAAIGLMFMAFLFAYLPVRLYVRNVPAQNLRQMQDGDKA